MTRNLKQALFSALLVWAVAYPVLGLKLSIVGINLAEQLIQQIAPTMDVAHGINTLARRDVPGARRFMLGATEKTFENHDTRNRWDAWPI